MPSISQYHPRRIRIEGEDRMSFGVPKATGGSVNARGRWGCIWSRLMAAAQEAKVEGEPGKERQWIVLVSQILAVMGPRKRERRRGL